MRSAPEPALSHDDPSSLAPPEVIGPYRVLHQIGSGVLGPVYRALHPDSQQIVAVKLFRLDWPPEQARALAGGLGTLIETLPPHPSLVAPLAAGLDGATAWLAQELVAADGLEARMRRRTAISGDVLVGVLRQVASVLDAANDAGWRHGALHPRDILVDTAGAARVTGVGVAQVVERFGAQAPRRRPFCAPERALGHPWDLRADVYALAAIAVEWVGQKRGRGAAEEDLEAALGRAGFDGSAAAAVLARGTAASSGQRPASATALLDALAATVVSHPDAESRRRKRAQAAPLFAAAAEAAPPPVPPAAPGRDEGHEAPPVIVEADVAPRPTDRAPEEEPFTAVVGADEPTLVVEPPPQPEAGAASADGRRSPVEASPPDAAGSDEPAAVEPPPPSAPVSPGEAPPAEPLAAAPAEPLVDAFDSGRRVGTPTPTHSMWGALAVTRVDGPVRTPAPPGPDLPIDGATTEGGEAPVERAAPASHDSEFWDQRLDAADERSAPAAAPAPVNSLAGRAWWPWALVLLVGVAIGFVLGRWSAAPAPRTAAVPAARDAAVERAELRDEPAQAEPAVSAPAPPPAASTVEASPPGAPAAVARPEPRREAPRRNTAPATPAPRAIEGQLAVRSTPAGARVRLNGTDRGSTPLTLRGLAPGRYTLEVARGGYLADTRRVEITARRPSQALEITLKPVPRAAPAAPAGAAASTASIEFVTRPPGSRVFVDGQPIGVTPLKLLEVAPGAKAIRFELAGHRTWTATVTVAAGEARRVAASLEPLP